MSTFAEFDSVMMDPRNRGDGASDVISVSADNGGGAKRSVRLTRAAASNDPADVAAVAAHGATATMSAPVGDRGANYARKRPLTGAAALSAVNALTGYRAAVNPEPSETVPGANGRRRKPAAV